MCEQPRLRRQRGAELVYHWPKSQSDGKQADLVLTQLALIERIAALAPPPRTHRRWHPWRCARPCR
ncbi:MAG: transposase [Rhodoferax sp.]|nr:transposase [Rhodoferax sp.]